MLTKEELELRRSGIAGTDIAALLGKSPYKSALGVYLDKKGLSEFSPTNISQEFGLEQEDFILRKYAQMEGCLLNPSPGFKRHPSIPYLVANVDGVRSDNIIVDAKNIGLYGDRGEYNYKAWGEQRTAQMPQHYYLQIAHYCLVWESHEGHMVPYFGGSDLRVYIYQKNEKIENIIKLVSKKFWEEHVLADKPPVDKGTYQEVAALWKAVNPDETIIATPNVEDLIKELRDIKATKDELDAKEDAVRAQVAAFMQEKGVLLTSQGLTLATWKEETRNRLDIEAFKKEEPELYQKYLRGIASRTFRLRKGENR